MRSKYEERIAKELKDAKIKFKYEEYTYEYERTLRKNRARCLHCGSTDLSQTGRYTPDFFIPNKTNKSYTIIEGKGRLTASDRAKLLAVRDAHPDLKNIKLMFQRDNKIHRKSKTKYSDWATANGFDYVIGTTVPKEWLK